MVAGWCGADWVARWHEMMVDGWVMWSSEVAEARRKWPGRGGSRRWGRSWGRGEMEIPGLKGIGAAARDFDPSSSLPLF